MPEPSYWGVEMVRFGKGQVILQAGYGIYLMTCSNRNCLISLLNKEFEMYYMYFVAIPIPDKMSGCLAEGKHDFKIVLKSQKFYTYQFSKFNKYLWVC